MESCPLEYWLFMLLVVVTVCGLAGVCPYFIYLSAQKSECVFLLLNKKLIILQHCGMGSILFLYTFIHILFGVWCDFDRASSFICGNKMPTRCNRGFYCRSYCLLNMFQAPLCPSSGAQECYTLVAACGISCCDFQVAGLVWSWGLCVRFAGWCPKHFEQAVRSAIKTSVASSWHFISTYYLVFLQSKFDNLY